MSIEMYRLLHLAGVLFLFAAIGAMCAIAMYAGKDDPSPKGKKVAGMLHGISLLVVLVAGVGMLHKNNLSWDVWVWGKLVIWIALGGIIVAIRKVPSMARIWLLAIPLLGAIAAALAVFRPGSISG
jgi:hypothetical protein